MEGTVVDSSKQGSSRSVIWITPSWHTKMLRWHWWGSNQCCWSTSLAVNKWTRTRWFKVTLSSPSWRSLSHLEGSLSQPKKVTLNHQETICYIPLKFNGWFYSRHPEFMPETIPVYSWIVSRVVSNEVVPTSNCLSHLECLSMHFWLIGPWKKWWIWNYPVCWRYIPRSSNHESMPIWNETADASADTQKKTIRDIKRNANKTLLFWVVVSTQLNHD